MSRPASLRGNIALFCTAVPSVFRTFPSSAFKPRHFRQFLPASEFTVAKWLPGRGALFGGVGCVAMWAPRAAPSPPWSQNRRVATGGGCSWRHVLCLCHPASAPACACFQLFVFFFLFFATVAGEEATCAIYLPWYTCIASSHVLDRARLRSGSRHRPQPVRFVDISCFRLGAGQAAADERAGRITRHRHKRT